MLNYEEVVERLNRFGITISDKSNGIFIFKGMLMRDEFKSLDHTVDFIVDVGGDVTYYKAFQYMAKVNHGGVVMLWFDKKYKSVINFLAVVSRLTSFYVSSEYCKGHMYVFLTRLGNKTNG